MRYAVDAGQSITSRRESKDSSNKKLEKEIARQAKRVLKKWCLIFGLDGWTITIIPAPGGSLQTPEGTACMSTTSHNGSKSARIWIDYEFEWNDEDGHNGFEFTLLHELLHIVSVEQGIDIFKNYLDKRGDKLYWTFEEEFIDRMAKILVGAANGT